MNAKTDEQMNDNADIILLTNLFKHPLGEFCAKVFIVFAAIYLLLPDFSGIHKLETDQSKLIALGLIKNPRVLLELSKTHENNGKLNKAISEMKVAIGILEIHNASKETMDFYSNRLESLIKKRDEEAALKRDEERLL